MIRALQPAELPGLLLLTARRLANQACPRERLGERPRRKRAAQDLVANLVPSRRRHHTFLWTQGRRLGGLLSCRSRSGLTTWEVDLLLLSTEEEEPCGELLGRLGAQATEAGVRRLFLRLSAESPVLSGARRAGFSGYLTEHLMRWIAEDAGVSTVAPPDEMRPRRPADDYALFRLYNLAVPTSVRLAEGLTLQEWQEAMAVRWGPGRRGGEVVLEREGALVGWLRIAAARRTGYLSIVVHPEAPGVFLDLVRLGLQRLRERPRLFLLLPDHQSHHRAALEEVGFESDGEYVSFVRDAPVRVRAPQLVPAQVT